MKQLKIEVEEDLYWRLKIIAVKEMKTLRALVTEALERILREHTEK